MTDNPYPKGLRLSEEEYKLVEAGLSAIAEMAKHVGEEQAREKLQVAYAHNKAMSLISRLKQFTMIGEGVPEDMANEHGENIQKAMMAGDVRQVSRALSRWIALLIRLEPDPAKTVAPQLVQMATEAAGQHQMQHIVPPILTLVTSKLSALKTRYEKEGWPDPKDVIEYLEVWLTHGIEAIQNGDDSPWDGDDDLG